MSTLTRKLTVVCLAVVFSALMYGCGGGDSKMASEGPVITDEPAPAPATVMIDQGLTIASGTSMIEAGTMWVTGEVAFTCPEDGPSCTITVADDGTVTSAGGMATAEPSTAGALKLAQLDETVNDLDVMVLMNDGLEIMAGEYTLGYGETMDAGDVAFACLPSIIGLGCAVTVAETEDDEGNIISTSVTYVGGEPTATASTAGNTKLSASSTVDISSVTAGYLPITPGVIVDILPDKNKDVGGANFACSEEGVRCRVTVTDDGTTVTSAGGTVTATNSMAVMTTIAAQALTLILDGTDDQDPPTIDTMDDGITRSTDGSDTTVTLMPDSGDAATVEYMSANEETPVIDGWIGITLNRSDDSLLLTPQDATVYTNIEASTMQKLMYGEEDGTAVPVIPTGTGISALDFEIDPDQDLDAINDDMNMDKELTGSYIMADGERIPGTFSCAAADCTEVTMRSVLGKSLLDVQLAASWEFVSDNYVEAEATQDADYMYFGYWLQSPNPETNAGDYEFAALHGGNDPFMVDSDLVDDADALKATYRGGAAGRYVTRDLGFTEAQIPDPNSPGYHGRFTATANLNAYFGEHDDFAADTDAGTPNNQNMIHGTITDFMDGNTDLGFKVTLNRAVISTNGIADGDTEATFNTSTGPAVGEGDWSAAFFGPNADPNDEDADVNTTLPGGVAGQFNAGSIYTKIDGAFAAEKE